MAETNQYALAHTELVEVIIKQCGVHEGRWSLMLSLAIGTGNFSPAPEQAASPGVVITIPQVGIQRVIEGQPVGPGSIIVDAAEVNPRKGKARKKA
ncbi:hypothetical protein [Reyranella sp.]|uniref:hypothetical protein n=1 Tax=Reyranella sp. TaxID=1929291 RepID=UPI003D097FA6